MVAQREVPDAPSAPVPMAQPPQTQAAILTELAARASWKQGVMGAMNVATRILAVRMILLLAVLGAVILTWLALLTADPVRLGAVALYTITVVMPLVWLSSRN